MATIARKRKAKKILEDYFQFIFVYVLDRNTLYLKRKRLFNILQVRVIVATLTILF
jgi:hypothetical protein